MANHTPATVNTGTTQPENERVSTDDKLRFYDGTDTGEVYVIRNDPEFANRMLTRTALLTAG